MQLPTLFLSLFAAAAAVNRAALPTANAFQLLNPLRPESGCVTLDDGNVFDGADIDVGVDGRPGFTPRCRDSNCKHDGFLLILVVLTDADHLLCMDGMLSELLGQHLLKC
jgi:hypothetical protein